MVAMVAALPYTVLKLAWALGWEGGFTRPHAFGSLAYDPLGFGDTSTLAVVAIAVAALTLLPIRHPAARFAVIAVGALGGLLLIPTGVVASAGLVAERFSAWQPPAGVLAPWVSAAVYPGLLVWIVTLIVAAAAFALRPRPAAGMAAP